MHLALLNLSLSFLQQEMRAERQEARLHSKAVNAALHGNIGKAIVLEVCLSYSLYTFLCMYYTPSNLIG